MTFELHYLTNQRGLRLRYGIHSPANARAHVLILQGRGEYIERYDETAHELASRGLGSVTFDFRGQGGSSRETASAEMGYVRDVADYVQDTNDIIAHIANRHRISCQYLLTHSTGGLVGMQILLAQSLPRPNAHQFDSAVMIAPFFGLGGPQWFALMARTVSAMLCRWGGHQRYLPGQKLLSPVQPFNPANVLTSDRHRYERNVALLRDNPALIVGGVSAGWLDACFRAQQDLHHHLYRAPAAADTTDTPDNSPRRTSPGTGPSTGSTGTTSDTARTSGNITDTAADMAKLAAAARQGAYTLPPVTMVLAGRDQVVSNPRTRQLFGNHPMIDIHEIAGARHEILQESDPFRQQFWQLFDTHMAG